MKLWFWLILDSSPASRRRPHVKKHDEDYYCGASAETSAGLTKLCLLGEEPIPAPICPQHTPHGIPWNRAQASEVRSQQLTASAMGPINSMEQGHLNYSTYNVITLVTKPTVAKLLIIYFVLSPPLDAIPRYFAKSSPHNQFPSLLILSKWILER
jgi:hypothetical protein